MTATVTVPIGSVASTSSPRIDTAHGSAAPGVPGHEAGECFAFQIKTRLPCKRGKHTYTRSCQTVHGVQ